MEGTNGGAGGGVDASDCPPNKRPKRIATEWRVYRSPQGSESFRVNDIVFVRPKSGKEKGQRGRVIGTTTSHEKNDKTKKKTKKEATIEWLNKGSSSTTNVSWKRLIPVFFPSSPLDSMLLVTPETLLYRNLASSQLLPDHDRVLEIGCSTGEASVILHRYARCWCGFDTSQNMVDACRAKIHPVAKMDALVDPAGAKQCANRLLEGDPTVVFMDIGGNRELAGVLRMLSWCRDYFSPRLIVVKSRALVSKITMEETTNDNSDRSTFLLPNGDQWFEKCLAESNANKTRLPQHPLQAPLRTSPLDQTTPICRYHNYDVKGCKRHKDGICPFDHVHCHLCLQLGHRALDCPQHVVSP